MMFDPKPSAKITNRHLLITLSIILLVEAPQVISAWITLAEKMPVFRTETTPTQVVQTQEHRQ